MYGWAIRTVAAMTTRKTGIRKPSNGLADPSAQRTIQITRPTARETSTPIAAGILAAREAVAHCGPQLRRAVEGGDHRLLGRGVLRRQHSDRPGHLDPVLEGGVADDLAVAHIDHVAAAQG